MRLKSISGRCLPRLKSFRKIPLEQIEIFHLANHLGNHNRTRVEACSLFRDSVPCLPGTLNVAGAISIGLGEVVAGIYIMRVESEGASKGMFSVTPTTKVKVRIADLSGNRTLTRIELQRALEFSKRALPLAPAAVNGRPE